LFIKVENTVAFIHYGLYFYNCLPKSFIEIGKFSVVERCLMHQLFNWQFLNSIFICLFISYSFRVKKIKAHLYCLPLSNINFTFPDVPHFAFVEAHACCLMNMSSCSQNRWQILSMLLSSSHLNSSWENTPERHNQLVSLTYLRNRLAVFVLFQHLWSSFFLSPYGLGC
jgi:hypothetical protein